ncbi:alpha/beta hydrolase family protein [Priestia abyssalis]|uniref:alpha/beta hydrolase family protein n=1 Tax=Priestia abyssalis TaxID=1221450 RepID=UPI00099595A3|nr:prolyl oligopeptidase family serine peptidase [Priestia abyssalis]
MKKFGIMMLVTVLTVALTAFFSKSDDMIMEKMPLRSPYAHDVDIYKLTYMSDGLKVKGFLLKPKESKGKLPLLVYNRGGMNDYGSVNNKRLLYLSSWAQKGYVVVTTQYRGNGGSEGKETYGGNDVNDIINLIHHAEKLPYVHPAQKVVIGYSRGGMMTYLLMKNGIHFNAAAVVSGITDMFQFYDGRGANVKKELRKMVGSPEAERKKYKSRSVVFWSEKINSPLLILHGTKDKKVHYSQAEKLVTNLKSLNKEYKYVLYEGDDHPLTQHFNEYNQEIEKWFAIHLPKRFSTSHE